MRSLKFTNFDIAYVTDFVWNVYWMFTIEQAMFTKMADIPKKYAALGCENSSEW